MHVRDFRVENNFLNMKHLYEIKVKQKMWAINMPMYMKLIKQNGDTPTV